LWIDDPHPDSQLLLSDPDRNSEVGIVGHDDGEVLLESGDDPIPLQSVVNLNSVESVSVGTLTARLGRLGDERMQEVCAALAVAVDCNM